LGLLVDQELQAYRAPGIAIHDRLLQYLEPREFRQSFHQRRGNHPACEWCSADDRALRQDLLDCGHAAINSVLAALRLLIPAQPRAPGFRICLRGTVFVSAWLHSLRKKPFVRARLQPCHTPIKIHKASAAEGLALELSREPFPPARLARTVPFSVHS